MSNDRRFVIEADSVPNRPGMMLVTVEALKELGGSASNQELDEKVIELEGVTEEEQRHTVSGNPNRPRVNYYLAWARTCLKKGNAIDNPSAGIWTLTDIGYEVNTINQTNSILNDYLKELRAQAKAKSKANEGGKTPTDESIEDDSDAQAAWKTSLLDVIGNIPPDAFERLSQRLLRQAGFTRVEVRGKSGDGGIDGVGVLRVNLLSFDIYFQCKRWKGSVGANVIREFRGSLPLQPSVKGLIITTARFTTQAVSESRDANKVAIDLIGGDELCDSVEETQPRCQNRND